MGKYLDNSCSAQSGSRGEQQRPGRPDVSATSVGVWKSTVAIGPSHLKVLRVGWGNLDAQLCRLGITRPDELRISN